MDKVKDIKVYETINFWEANPQFTIMEPFSTLYKNDKTKDKDTSSKHAWCVSLFCETFEKSIFAHFPEDERKEELSEWNKKINWKDKIIQNCIKKYPYIVMTAAARALKEEEDILMKRTVFLRKSYDQAIEDANVELAEKLEKLLANSGKLYDNLEKAMEKFTTEVNKRSQLRGGREESYSEQGFI